MSDTPRLHWHKVLEHGELPEGRVTTVLAGKTSVCMSHFEGQYGALTNHCPHQGGPMGEGAIENGLLRCPWHGWDFHPIDGKAPGFDDGLCTYPCEVRDDGIYVGLEDEAPHERTVTDVMAETFVAWGIDTVFGMVGHSNLGLADALRRREAAGDLRFIGIRHEGAAAFAASAYGKLTGRPAACFTIAGPGATNLLTGLYDAKVDRAPVLALTGQVDVQVLGPGAFQEVDLAGAFGDVAAWSQTVYTTSKPAELATLAVKNAIIERDVAHLIFPDDVQTLPAGEMEASGPTGRIGPQSISPPRESVDEALELLRGAKRPVMIVGHGARFDMDAVIEFAERLGAPVLTTFKGKGLIPDAHPLSCGVLGRSGTFIASYFMNEADLLVVLGASFSNHTGISPKYPTIQVDLDRKTLGKFHPVTVPVWGEIATTVGQFMDGLEGAELAGTEVRSEIADRWTIWRAEKESRARDDHGNGVSSAAVFAALSDAAPEDSVVTVDVGNHAYSFGRYFECTKQSVLMSGYLGSIGFGYPAAMGAWCADRGARKVIAVTGDGGFAQYMAEVTTGVKYGMDICHVLLNNNELGKISKEQRAGNWDVWKTGLHNPDFSEYARGCGALGIRVERAEDLAPALAKALAHDGPAMVEVLTDPELI
ncbi:MAG: thiamine pyrophosphate-dependent enzyme [Planctomycetota bacterium]